MQSVRRNQTFFIGKVERKFANLSEVTQERNLQTSPKLHTPFPIKRFEIRFACLFELSPLQEMDKSWISPISPTSGLMSAPLWWNRTYQEHEDVE